MKRIVLILALVAPPASASTIFLPGFIEECRMVTDRAETFSGPAVLMAERGSRGLVCAVPATPENPFEYDALADLKGWHNETPEPLVSFGGQYLPSAQASARATASASVRSWASAGAFFIPHVRTPVEPPAPVPLPASGWLMLAALAALIGWRKR